MLALTTVTKKAYEQLLEDGTHNIGELLDKYGAGFPMRLQGILCAMAVHQCKVDADELTPDRGTTADDLYALVKYFGYDEIFEDNKLGEFRPKEVLLDSMLYSMCQAETGDYGEDEEE